MRHTFECTCEGVSRGLELKTYSEYGWRCPWAPVPDCIKKGERRKPAEYHRSLLVDGQHHRPCLSMVYCTLPN